MSGHVRLAISSSCPVASVAQLILQSKRKCKQTAAAVIAATDLPSQCHPSLRPILDEQAQKVIHCHRQCLLSDFCPTRESYQSQIVTLVEL